MIGIGLGFFVFVVRRNSRVTIILLIFNPRYIRPLHQPQTWVSPAILATSVPQPVRSAPSTARRGMTNWKSERWIVAIRQILTERTTELLTRVAKPPTPVSAPRESTWSAPVEATRSSVPSVSTPVTSHGVLRVLPVRPV